MPRKNIQIERSWSGMMGGWANRSDYDADTMLQMLDELDEALRVRRAQFSNDDYMAAKAIFTKWNSKSIIRHNERNDMLSELKMALDRLGIAAFAPTYSYSLDPLKLKDDDVKQENGDASNLYKVERSDMDLLMSDGIVRHDELKPNKAVTDINDLRSTDEAYLRIAKVNLEKEVTDEILKKSGVKAISLIDCKFPKDWENVFSCMPSLRRLVFFKGHKSESPSDMLASMENCNATTMEFVMADFLLDGECMENLAKISTLQILNLCRTVTNEKVKAKNADIDQIANSLRNLIRLGNLKELNIDACSAFTLDHIQMLAQELKKNNGRLIVGGSSQMDLLQL